MDLKIIYFKIVLDLNLKFLKKSGQKKIKNLKPRGESLAGKLLNKTE